MFLLEALGGTICFLAFSSFWRLLACLCWAPSSNICCSIFKSLPPNPPDPTTLSLSQTFGSRLLSHLLLCLQTSCLPLRRALLATLGPSEASRMAPHLGISNLITAAKPHWPCQATHLQILRVRTWTTLGGHHSLKANIYLGNAHWVPEPMPLGCCCKDNLSQWHTRHPPGFLIIFYTVQFIERGAGLNFTQAVGCLLKVDKWHTNSWVRTVLAGHFGGEQSHVAGLCRCGLMDWDAMTQGFPLPFAMPLTHTPAFPSRIVEAMFTPFGNWKYKWEWRRKHHQVPVIQADF